jgi:hypothetical protein
MPTGRFRVAMLVAALTLAAMLSAATAGAQSVLQPDFYATNSSFGNAVAVSRDGATLVVGTGCVGVSSCNNGWASVYTLSGSWSLQQILRVPRDGMSRFGLAVALAGDGNTLLVSDTYHDNYNPGQVHVFTRQSAVWSLQQTLSSPSAGDDGFGTSVALSADGTTAFVGASSSHCPKAPYCGAVFVYTHEPGGWSLRQTLREPLPANGDVFGWVVAVDGDMLLVGAPGRNCSRGDWCGAVFVFRHDGQTWQYTQELSAPDPVGDDQFGESLAIAPGGKWAAVGAPWRTCIWPVTCVGAGRVSMLALDDTGEWVLWRHFVPTKSVRSGIFGMALAFAADGNTLLIGQGVPNLARAPSAWLFRTDRGDWKDTLTRAIYTPSTTSDQVINTRIAVAPAGDTLFVGIPTVESVYLLANQP